MYPVALLNTPIMTTEGLYSLTPFKIHEIGNFLADRGGETISAIGHEGTAQVLTELLGFEVKVNRLILYSFFLYSFAVLYRTTE